MPGQAAGTGAHDRTADDRGWEREPDQGSDAGPGPSAVLGRLRGLRDPDLAVSFLADHRRVEGPDRARGVEVEHGLVVGLGIRDAGANSNLQRP